MWVGRIAFQDETEHTKQGEAPDANADLDLHLGIWGGRDAREREITPVASSLKSAYWLPLTPESEVRPTQTQWQTWPQGSLPESLPIYIYSPTSPPPRSTPQDSDSSRFTSIPPIPSISSIPPNHTPRKTLVSVLQGFSFLSSPFLAFFTINTYIFFSTSHWNNSIPRSQHN